MPMTLQTVLSKIERVPSKENAALLSEFADYMKQAGAGEHHIKKRIVCSYHIWYAHAGHELFRHYQGEGLPETARQGTLAIDFNGLTLALTL